MTVQVLPSITTYNVGTLTILPESTDMSASNDHEPPIIIDTGATPTAAVIWLHGLGADGSDFEPVVPALALPDTSSIRFVFPHAPIRPVTINNGMSMRAWYDIVSFDGRLEDESGIRASAMQVERLIVDQASLGIPASRIVLAGFSQGGAIALHAGLRHANRLAGILALSTYLPLRERLGAERSDANHGVAILMIHGTRDEIVSHERGLASRDALTGIGQPVDWREYPIGHELCMPEVAAISSWLQKVLGPG